MSLNGEWDFLGEGPLPPELPRAFSEKALVPSATQAETSCLDNAWVHGWYRRMLTLPDAWKGRKVLLHFEAVGGVATVFANGQALGTNTGSWNRFSFVLPACATCELLVHFDDREPRLPRGKPEYLSGIWQTVWLEPVAADYIRSFRQTPDIDAGRLTLDVLADSSDLSIVARAFESGTEVARVAGAGDERLALELPDAKRWSPESPFLYDLVLELRRGDEIVDRIESYFGMRKIACAEVDGVPRMLLNNEVYFQVGLLDQGQWPESFFTPPTDEALKWEIETAREMGFNILRKHVKVEASRWYYWCDVLGMLVWQDLPCQMYFSDKAHKTEEDKQFMRDDLQRMMNQFYNHPSIICWVIFNEAWGQFDPRDMTIRARKLDGTRLINTTSHVWPNAFNRQRYNVDLYDFHCYSRDLQLGDAYDNVLNNHIPSALGEFGGIGYLIPQNTEKHEGYRGYGADAHSEEELLCHYKALILQTRALRETHALCAIIYTELTDWMAEINGFITYDRKVIKVDVEALKAINQLFVT